MIQGNQCSRVQIALKLLRWITFAWSEIREVGQARGKGNDKRHYRWRAAPGGSASLSKSHPRSGDNRPAWLRVEYSEI
jgi:hypothetical protein